MTELNDKVVIVTGGASGIGLATAKAFLDKGAKVVIGDYNNEAGAKVEKELKEKYDSVLFVSVNVADEKSVENLVSETVKHFGRLDVIFNNAGIGVQTPTHELTAEEYHKVIS